MFYGDSGQLDAGIPEIGGKRIGAAVLIPLYKSRSNTCDQSLELYTYLNRLEIAEKLVTAGAMTNKEYMELAQKIKDKLLSVK